MSRSGVGTRVYVGNLPPDVREREIDGKNFTSVISILGQQDLIGSFWPYFLVPVMIFSKMIFGS